MRPLKWKGLRSPVSRIPAAYPMRYVFRIFFCKQRIIGEL
jgi:hypothetical protein